AAIVVAAGLGVRVVAARRAAAVGQAVVHLVADLAHRAVVAAAARVRARQIVAALGLAVLVRAALARADRQGPVAVVLGARAADRALAVTAVVEVAVLARRAAVAGRRAAAGCQGPV